MVDDICYKYAIAVNQRFNEIMRGLDLSGVSGFKEKGCFECEGKCKDRDCYQTREDLEKGIKNLGEEVRKMEEEEDRLRAKRREELIKKLLH